MGVGKTHPKRFGSHHLHPLVMHKISNRDWMGTVRGSKREAREFYISSIRKAEPRDVNVFIVDMDVPGKVRLSTKMLR